MHTHRHGDFNKNGKVFKISTHDAPCQQEDCIWNDEYLCIILPPYGKRYSGFTELFRIFPAFSTKTIANMKKCIFIAFMRAY